MLALARRPTDSAVYQAERRKLVLAVYEETLAAMCEAGVTVTPLGVIAHLTDRGGTSDLAAEVAGLLENPP